MVWLAWFQRGSQVRRQDLNGEAFETQGIGKVIVGCRHAERGWWSKGKRAQIVRRPGRQNVVAQRQVREAPAEGNRDVGPENSRSAEIHLRDDAIRIHCARA